MTGHTKFDAVDPLLDCLILVARHHGHHASRATLSAGLPLRQGKLSPDLLARAAERASLATRISRQELDSIDIFLFPAILFLNNDGACVLQAKNTASGTFTVLLPETGGGAVEMSKSDLEARYSGAAALVAPQLRFDARSPTVNAPRSGHWFWSAILRQRFTYKDVILGALLVNLFSIGLPIFTMNVYDRVVPNNAVETLWSLVVGISLLLVADLVIRRLRTRLVDQASAQVDVEISASLMAQLLGIRYGERPISTGAFSSNMRAFEQVRDLIASSTVIAVVDLPFVILFFICVAWISPWLALPGLVMFSCIVIFGYLIQERLHTLSESSFQSNCLRNSLLVESLIGLETIKAQHAESAFQARWEQSTRYSAKSGIQMRELSAMAISGANWFQQMSNVILILVGVYLIFDKSLTLGGLIACSMLTNRALAPAAQIVGLLLQYQNARTALGSLETFMAKGQDRNPGQAYVEHNITKGSIEFRDVSFAYPGREEKVLQNISFRINPGERVAVLGRVGSGKSTLQRMITNIYSPSSGMILLDGIDVRQLDPAETRSSVGFVSQDVMLFFGTLRENIALGKPYVDDAAILAAAQIAGLTDFINAHPEGLAMAVGERGELLSGGQRQAVGIARAVLNQAPILLMDEPTSAMDYSSEAAVSTNIAKFCEGRTLIVATHRTTLLTLCDRIIVMDAGRIVADGPRESVMAALIRKNHQGHPVNIQQKLTTAATATLRALEWLRIRIEKIIAPVFPPPEPIAPEGLVPFSAKLDEILEGDARRSMIHQSRVMIRTVLIVFVVAIIWSALTRVDEITRADAKVIPSRQLQVVQSADGGIVSEILVREGQAVEKGQILLKLDQTRVTSNVKESRAQTFSLRAKVARLRALAEGSNFVPPEAVEPDEKRVVQEEQRLFEDRRSELSALIGITRQQVAQRQQELVEMQARRTQAQRSLELSAKELEVTRPLLKSGAVSEVDILRLEREVARFRGEQDQAGAQIARVQAAILEAQRKTQEAELNFKNETRKELAETMSKLNSMSEGEVALTDRVDKSLVRSPVNGIVQRLLINTVGGVAVPAKDLVEIVPVDEALVLEARVPHKDIAFLSPGQRAVVKFTAYDFSIYGGLDAVVNNISPDAITTEDGIAYYVVRVQTEKTQLGKNLPIIPGMRATVDIISGQKSILSYLMKPVLRAKAYAFSER